MVSGNMSALNHRSQFVFFQFFFSTTILVQTWERIERYLMINLLSELLIALLFHFLFRRKYIRTLYKSGNQGT